MEQNPLEVSAFYDSDEDVAWGPVSLQEIKNDLKRESRRQTIDFGDLNYGWDLSSSEYTTADETVKSEESHIVPNISAQMDAIICLSSDEDDSVGPSGTSLQRLQAENNYQCNPNSTNSNKDNSSYLSCSKESEENILTNNNTNKDEILEDSNEHVNDFILDCNSEDMNNTLDDSNSTGIQSGNENVYNFVNNNSENMIDILDDSNSTSILNSSGENTDTFLNDTIDKMTRLLENGIDADSGEENIEPNKISYNQNIVPVVKSRIPTAIYPTPTQEHHLQQSNFKVPSMTIEHSKKPSSSITKISPFKNIVSPVRAYIQNSPMAVLKQNVRYGALPLGTPKKTSNYIPKKHRNLVFTFPPVLYRPSKQVIEMSDIKIILPQNIKSLIKDRTVIKHEQRVRVNMDESVLSVTEKLSRKLLSNVDDKNMSLHVAKDGLNI